MVKIRNTKVALAWAWSAALLILSAILLSPLFGNPYQMVGWLLVCFIGACSHFLLVKEKPLGQVPRLEIWAKIRAIAGCLAWVIAASVGLTFAATIAVSDYTQFFNGTDNHWAEKKGEELVYFSLFVVPVCLLLGSLGRNVEARSEDVEI